MKTENKISEMSLSFPLQMTVLYKKLIANKEFVLSKQLLRYATAGIAANVEEAEAAQSKKNFISKMSLASKEAGETIYWLRLLEKSRLIEVDYSAV